MENNPTLKEFLISKDIHFVEYGDDNLYVNDSLLIPYEIEIRQLFPEFLFIWDVQRYRNEPNRSSDEYL